MNEKTSKALRKNARSMIAAAELRDPNLQVPFRTITIDNLGRRRNEPATFRGVYRAMKKDYLRQTARA